MRELYRSVAPVADASSVHGAKATRRLPTYVPYLVDNLWEWKRPEQFPSRRYAVFASPKPELAVKSGPAGGQTFRVDIRGTANVAQVCVPDSRDHNECKSLSRLLKELLGQSWLDADLHIKQDAGRLYIPGLSKAEIDQLFAAGVLSQLRQRVWEAIRYWDDVRIVGPNESWPSPDGEVFFVADQWALLPWRPDETH